jgi:hypothetical protein
MAGLVIRQMRLAEHGFQIQIEHMTPKQRTIQVLGTLPEDSSYSELQEEVKILAALEEAECSIREGRVVPHEEVKQRLAEWTSS